MATNQTTGAQSAGKLRLKCPHCLGPARVRHSRELAATFRDGIVECQNIMECGWRGRVAIEYVATLTPSACPNSEIDLPQSPYVLPNSKHALPVNLRGGKHNAAILNPQQKAKRDQLDMFTLH